MTRRNRKKTTRQVAPAGSNVVGGEGEKPLKGRYDEARRLAQAGKLEEAIRIYDQLKTVAGEPRLRALVENDLGAIAAVQGRAEDALEGWKRALAEDHDCQPARLNREMIEAEFERVRDTAPPRGAAAACLRPSRAGTDAQAAARSGEGGDPQFPVQLALDRRRECPHVRAGQVPHGRGYEVRHIYARYQGWGIGGVAGELPYPSEMIELNASSLRLEHIRKVYRQAVDAFDPDQVIITDSWNIKPILAQAMRGYPYILRMQAMECLCPLNNLRLLAGEGGRFRQCPLHQLASPMECARCLERNGHYAGALHQAERALCGVGSPEYHRTLIQAFAEAEAVLVVNPLAEAMMSPYARSVRVVTAGIDPARFPWPQPTEERQREPWAEGRAILCFAGLIQEPMKGFRGAPRGGPAVVVAEEGLCDRRDGRPDWAGRRIHAPGRMAVAGRFASPSARGRRGGLSDNRARGARTDGKTERGHC